jgi:hypothetical protein
LHVRRFKLPFWCFSSSPNASIYQKIQAVTESRMKASARLRLNFRWCEYRLISLLLRRSLYDMSQLHHILRARIGNVAQLCCSELLITNSFLWDIFLFKCRLIAFNEMYQSVSSPVYTMCRPFSFHFRPFLLYTNVSTFNQCFRFLFCLQQRKNVICSN